MLDFDPNDAPQQPGGGDRWVPAGHQWLRIHSLPRKRLFNPNGVDGGPGIDNISAWRTTHLYFRNGSVRSITDDWTGENADRSEGIEWTGVTVLTLASAPLSVPDLLLAPNADETGNPVEQRSATHNAPTPTSE